MMRLRLFLVLILLPAPAFAAETKTITVTSPDFLERKKAEEAQAQESAMQPEPKLIQPQESVDSAIKKMSTDQMFEQAAQPQKKKVDKTYRYAPEHCDFEITFPEAPYKSRRCPERDPQSLTSNQGQCYELQSYTMVFDLASTVDVSVNCIAAKPGSTDAYSEGVMRAALQGMVDRNSVLDYQIDYRDMGEARQASLNGIGQTGNQEKIYSAQIWAGPQSVMTVEAELIGRSQPQADAQFRDILKSIHVKLDPPPEPEESEESEEGEESTPPAN